MKKMSLLVFALVLALPGCGNKKKETTQSTRKNTVKTYAETSGDVVDMSDENEDSDEEDEDSEDIDFGDLDFDNLDMDELDKYLDSLEAQDLGDEDEEEVEEEESEESTAFNWIDAQVDDEFKKLYFSFNHYGIREDQKSSLKHDIEQVKQFLADADTEDKPTVVIEGHACQEGSPAFNLGLSEKRAKSVADLFVEAGVDRNVIKVVGRGQECPTIVNGKAVNGSREQRAPNRRVEVRVIYT